jgi:ArsR family transcriptional regulator, zinc-responsive transcriptional repressor
MVEAAARQGVDQRVLGAGAELLRALAAPHRLAMVVELADGPRCVHELEEIVGVSQSLASQHLRVLRNSGLVSGTRRGKETVYSLVDAHVAHIARDALAHGREWSSTPVTAISREETSAEEHEI